MEVWWQKIDKADKTPVLITCLEHYVDNIKIVIDEYHALILYSIIAVYVG